MASRLATALAARGATWELVRGTGVLADLSGFTRLTESLVSRGPEGVELLHRSLTTCFDALLGGSVELGGDIVGFAGDAALVWFDGDGHVERAARAAASMPGDLGAVPAALTARTRLRASIGLHSGAYLAVPVPVSGRQGVALCGPAMSALARLEQAAASDQVLASHSTAAALPTSWSKAATENGVELDRAKARRHSPPNAASDDTTTGAGEHQLVSVGFLMLPELDALFERSGPDVVAARVRHVADLLADVADANAVTVIDTDVGVDCVKFYVAAGAPRAVDDDDIRLLRTLRRVIDEADVPLRAGAQRGRGFSDLLGARGRRVFTVLGDTVNVAARALGKAADHELVMADGLATGLDRWLVAAPMGPQLLKNRVEPMPMWRVESVAPAPHRRVRAGEMIVDRFRRAEWEHLIRLWKETVDGSGASAAIVGEPGMGAAELVAGIADLAGSSATSLVADRFLRHVPYAAVNALVVALAETMGGLEEPDGGERVDRLSDQTGRALEWLSTHTNSLPAALREWTPAALDLVAGRADAATEPGTASRRARQVLVALISAAAPTHWFLAVEDAGHLDQASQQIVGGLAAQATSVAHLIVTTHDTPDAVSGAADVTINLTALPDTTMLLAIHELAPQLRDDQATRLVAAAGGNPLVLSGLLARADNSELPDSIERLAAVVVDALPADVRARILDAAVFGIEFDIGDVARVLDDVSISAASFWRQAATVLSTNDERTWRFRHHAYRDVAYHTASFARRRRIHDAIAADLAGDPSVDPGLLALHLDAAGRIDDAYPHAIDAARSARARGAAADAVELFERAVAIARRVDRPSVGGLLVELGNARVRTGDLDGAVAAYRAAAKVRLEPRARAELCHLRADLALSRRQRRSARQWIERGRALVDGIEPPPLDVTASLLLHEAVLLDLDGRHDAALEPARRASAIAADLGSPRLRALVHLQLEAILFNLMDPECIEHGRALVDLAVQLGDDRLLDQALNNTGITSMYLGRWDEALAQYQRARAHAQRCGHVADVAIIDQNTGFLLYRRGRLDEAEQLAREARRVLATVHDEYGVGISTLLLAMAAATRARFEEATSWLADARARFVQLGDEPMVVDCDVVGLDLLLRQGLTSEVSRRARAIETQLVHAEPEVTVSYGRILGAAEAADTETASAGLDRLRRALAHAREHHLLYEVYLCLDALVVAGDQSSADERDHLRSTLGISVDKQAPS